MNSLKEFGVDKKISVKLPLNSCVINDYIEWCYVKKNLKASTIKSYISSIATAHKLNDLDSSCCYSFISKQMLQGIENLEFYNNICKKTRKVMTLPLLKLAGHELANSNWCSDSKQVIWTVLTTAFFGSFRLGEILSQSESNYNPSETLLWDDIIFRDDDSV